ncbi:hypothetical protein UFOVP4_11 [uncultured Caudovirales phage]|uniref:Uncharacterized protein n=1 Tax=uncultured Caudovirales phage TaxID=2100421 RepID=A0A6J7VKM5_9CAUD|nr:hypothetical protein UFOVP4_11 [uncultured Caudovirales phage]CAB4241336.1 hypothetical protein UFOVP64_48 [uncultured Caudovirales phage]CAB5078963.1 hypothetical protein UFOVP145_4 [uncultured Caudovirales phage]
MQVCKLEVRLNDSPGHTVHKTDVTPAEIQVLQAIHGESAVANIQPITMDKRSQTFEWDRLTGIYGRAPDGLMDAGNGALLERLFPGASKKLPVSLKDIGMGHLSGSLRLAKNAAVADEIVEEEEVDDGEEA